MNQRTCDIIMICKSDIENEPNIRLDKIKQYMSRECCIPIEYYTQSMTEGIMFDAVCNYIDTCDKPSLFLKELRNVKRWINKSMAEIIVVAFSFVQVKEVDEDVGEIRCINGFTKELLNKRSDLCYENP